MTNVTEELITHLRGHDVAYDGGPIVDPDDPPGGPPHAVGKRERRMAERGHAAGVRAGRHDEHLPPCPYPNEGRPRWLWLMGAWHGREKGRKLLADVRRSYREGLERLEAGRPKVW